MIENSLTGKTALVTGASRGIGAEVSRRLAGQGATVAVHYSGSRDAAEALAMEIGNGAFAVQADVRDTGAIAAMFGTLDTRFPHGLDILVANAGVAGGGAIPDTDEATFDLLFDTNVKGLFFVMQHAIPRLVDGGAVVTTGSVASRGAAAPRAAYSASKLAGHGLTLSLAQELAPRHIRVNGVAPGAVSTDLIADARQNPAFEQAVSAMTAFRRLGEPSDIADAVLLLLQPEAGWITGQIIEVSGGLRL
jgi:NAD(P)-dependent dehydrogenase (short-subunit alcohol dehydrogenase family)